MDAMDRTSASKGGCHSDVCHAQRTLRPPQSIQPTTATPLLLSSTTTARYPEPPLETPRNKYYVPLTENQPIMPRGGEYTDGPTIQSDNAIESGENKIAGAESVRIPHTSKTH